MYRKYGRPKWILVGQMLKWLENGQWPIVISSTTTMEWVNYIDKIGKLPYVLDSPFINIFCISTVCLVRLVIHQIISYRFTGSLCKTSSHALILYMCCVICMYVCIISFLGFQQAYLVWNTSI